MVKAPGVPAQAAVSKQMRARAFQNLPFFPAGQWFTPTGYRSDLTGIVEADYMLS